MAKRRTAARRRRPLTRTDLEDLFYIWTVWDSAPRPARINFIQLLMSNYGGRRLPVIPVGERARSIQHETIRRFITESPKVSYTKTARLFGVSRATVVRATKKSTAVKSAAPRQKVADALMRAVCPPGATLEEMHKRADAISAELAGPSRRTTKASR